MAGTVPVLAPNSITGLTGLTRRPVFFARLHNAAQASLVIKGERSQDPDAPLSIRWSSKLMKHVNNRLVNTKIMSPAEIGIFRQAAQQFFAPNSVQLVNSTMNHIWVKMPYVNGLSDADYFSDAGVVVPSRIKRVLTRFFYEEIWSDLGKIVAVDIFNCNNDRFDTETGAWNNLGNVMFLEGGATSVIGLDTFDPASDHSNLNQQGGFENLRILTSADRQRQFALACTRGVASEMRRRMQQAGMTKFSLAVNNGGRILVAVGPGLDAIFEPFAPIFQAGLAAGAEELKTYLQQKVQQYRRERRDVPLGITSRMVYLGWGPATIGSRR